MYFKTIRRKLGEFIFPNLTRLILRMDGKLRFMSQEYEAMRKAQEQLRFLLAQIEESKREIQASGKTIVIKGPVVFLGSLAACQIKLQPEIHQEIVLGRVELESLLKLSGSHVKLDGCIIDSQPKETAVHIVSSTEESKMPDA